MGRNLGLLLGICSLFVGFAVAEWYITNTQKSKTDQPHITLNNYCESWRINVELHNIRNFEVVPEECTQYIGKYMSSTQYKVDSVKAIEECSFYLHHTFQLIGDGKDAWVFDIDDTLLSNVPYFKEHRHGGEVLNITAFEEWVSQRQAPALQHTKNLFREIKRRGIKIFLISSRGEHLRDATTDNLLKVGFSGWSGLILRSYMDHCKTVQQFMGEQRDLLISKGYRLWGIVGSQWTSILEYPIAMRTFKLPNPLYYDP